MVKVDAATKQNRSSLKPNEDSFYFDTASGLFCVADGVSRFSNAPDKYPIPSLGEFAARQMTNNCHQLTETATGPLSLTDLSNLFRQTSDDLNHFVRENGPFDFYERDYPGTIGTLAVIEGDHLGWVHLGDTLLLLIRAQTGLLLTNNQTAIFRSWLGVNRAHLPADKHDRVRYIHQFIRNNDLPPDLVPSRE